MIHDNLPGHAHGAPVGPMDGMSDHELDTDWVDQQIGYRLRRASAAMAADYAAAAAGTGLRPVLVSMLSVIAANPGVGQSELGAALGIQRTNVTPLTAQLEADRLVVRRPSRTDGRKVELHLTDDGVAALAAGTQLIADHEERMTRHLDEPERRRLLELLERIGR